MARTTPYYSYIEMLGFFLDAESSSEIEGYALFLLEEAQTYQVGEVFSLLAFYRLRLVELIAQNK